MKISEAIQQLQTAQEQHGDMDITFSYSIKASDESNFPAGLASKNQLERRLTICADCDRYEIVKIPLTNVDVGRCKECGCVVSIKARLPGMNCPLGKW